MAELRLWSLHDEPPLPEWGQLFINSNETGLRLGNRRKQDIDLELRGTAICMVMNTGRIHTLRRQLARFSAEGDKAAKALGMEFIVSASTASRMLARDFEPED